MAIKIWSISIDVEEMEQAFTEEILLNLINYSNQFQNYDQAIRTVENQLKKLIAARPIDKAFIKKCADQAGVLFIQKVGTAKLAQSIKRATRPEDLIGIPKIKKVIQHPPKPLIINSGDRTRQRANLGLGQRCGEKGENDAK